MGNPILESPRERYTIRPPNLPLLPGCPDRRGAIDLDQSGESHCGSSIDRYYRCRIAACVGFPHRPCGRPRGGARTGPPGVAAAACL